MEKGETRAETAWWCTRYRREYGCFARGAARGWVRESFSAEVKERVVAQSNFRSVESVGPSAIWNLCAVKGADTEAKPCSLKYPLAPGQDAPLLQTTYKFVPKLDLRCYDVTSNLFHQARLEGQANSEFVYLDVIYS